MKTLCVLLGFVLATGCTQVEPMHVMVLYDVTGSEVARLPYLRRFVMQMAEPKGLGLLYDGDTLTVIPVRPPRKLDATYPALVEVTMEEGSAAPRRQIDVALPRVVDQEPFTDLSASLRAAAAVMRLHHAGGRNILIVSGNGEDHGEPRVTPEEVQSAFRGAVVLLINSGEPFAGGWVAFFRKAGARDVWTYDQAGTQDLYEHVAQLRDRLDRVKWNQ